MVKQTRFTVALFAMILLTISLASASDLRFNQTTFGLPTYNVQQGSFITFNVLLFNENDTYPITDITLKGASSTISNLANNSNQTVSFRIDVSDNEDLGNKIYFVNATGYLNGTLVTSENITVTLNITQSDKNRIIYEICGDNYAPQNISIGEIEDDEKGNDEEWEWRPSNEISITVNDIKNNVDDDEKFDISLIFYRDGEKVSGSKIASDDEDLEIDNLKIDGKDDKDATFEFKVVGDVDADDYDLYVKVSGKYGCYAKKLQDNNGEVSIEKEDDDYSIVTNVEGSNIAECGESISLTVDVSNIGDEDADRVKVVVYNKELGINEYKEIDGLDEGDEGFVVFNLNIPSTVTAQNYKLLFYTQFDYDEDDDTYGEYSDDEYDYTYFITVSGNCVDLNKPTITASLDSEARVGQEMIVSVTFKNNANSSVNTIISPKEFESWANVVGVEPSVATVSKGESKIFYVTLEPLKAGQKTFNINVLYDGKSLDQTVTVSIEEDTSVMGFLKEKLGKVGAYLVIGIAILVLLIILILVLKLVFFAVRK